MQKRIAIWCVALFNQCKVTARTTEGKTKSKIDYYGHITWLHKVIQEA